MTRRGETLLTKWEAAPPQRAGGGSVTRGRCLSQKALGTVLLCFSSYEIQSVYWSYWYYSTLAMKHYSFTDVEKMFYIMFSCKKWSQIIHSIPQKPKHRVAKRLSCSTPRYLPKRSENTCHIKPLCGDDGSTRVFLSLMPQVNIL